MRNKTVLSLMCALMLVICSGCQLAREDAAGAADRLMGVYVTTEYIDLFDMESYLNDNLRVVGGDIVLDGDTSAYEGRFYATRVEEEGDRPDSYEFKGLEGSAFYSLFSQDDETGEGYYHSVVSGGISDAHSHYTVTDDGERTELSASVYFDANGMSPEFYCNPVYQTADGQVYLTSGSGISTAGVLAEGSMMSQKLEETSTITVNGEKEELGLSVEINIVGVRVPEKYMLLYMDESNQLLRTEEYAPGTVMSEMTIPGDTAYMILEAHKLDGAGELAIDREIIDRGDEYLTTFWTNTDGICVKGDTILTWN